MPRPERAELRRAMDRVEETMIRATRSVEPDTLEAYVEARVALEDLIDELYHSEVTENVRATP